jgi:hypothetical protein
VGHDGLRTSFFEEKTTVVGFRSRPPGNPPNQPPGTVFGFLKADGSIGVKILWWRDRRGFGRLFLRGRVLPGRAQFTMRSTDSFSRRRFVPSIVRFPRAGCWSLAVKSGMARLRFVVWVIEEDQLPPEPAVTGT